MKKLPFDAMPAVGRVSVSSPAVMRPLGAFNKGRYYANQIKPFNFLMTCQTRQFGHPTGADPAKFHLILPWEMNPRKWLTGEWIDQVLQEAIPDHDNRRPWQPQIGARENVR